VVADPEEQRGTVYLTSSGPVRIAHPPEGFTELEAGDALFLMTGTSSLGPAPGATGPAEVVVGHIEFATGPIRAEGVTWPSPLHLRAADDTGGLVERLVGEVRAARLGWEAVATALGDALLVTAIRVHRLPDADCPAHGWLRGLSDPEIGRALRLMHERPARPWTVAELADHLSVSRSAFAARFKQVTGRPPLAYLTWWRLCRAAARLRRRDGATVAQVAREVGYETEAAFGKAFRRQFGRTPGQVRREGADPRRATPLQVELKKRNPFDVREQEVALNLLRSAANLSGEYVEFFAIHGLNKIKYNVLRILRGEGTVLPRAEVRSRLVTDDGTMGESVTSLAEAGLVEPEGPDRLRITSSGEALLATIDGPLIDLHRRQLAHFSPKELAELDRLLVKARRSDQ